MRSGHEGPKQIRHPSSLEQTFKGCRRTARAKEELLQDKRRVCVLETNPRVYEGPPPATNIVCICYMRPQHKIKWGEGMQEFVLDGMTCR